MIKKLLAAALGLVIFLIFWFTGLAIIIAVNGPILIGLLIWTILSAKIFRGVYGVLT